MIIPRAPQTNNNSGICIPPDIEIINENIYYYVSRSGFEVYLNDTYYGTSTGYSLRPTANTSGAIEIVSNGFHMWIRGNLKYKYDNVCILNDITID